MKNGKHTLRAIGDALRRPADAVAARVTAPGPKWCEPAEKPKFTFNEEDLIRRRKKRGGRKTYQKRLQALVNRMSIRQRGDFEELIMRAPRTHMNYRRVLALVILGLPCEKKSEERWRDQILSDARALKQTVAIRRRPYEER